MGVRTRVKLTVEVGPENSLDDALFERDLEELLDTMEDANTETFQLAAGETNRSMDLGDVQEVRLVYIEADGEVDVSFGSGVATAAIVTGVAGSFPTGFAGGEAMTIDIDNFGNIIVTFTVGASAVQDVVNELNAAFALGGFLSGGVPVAPFSVSGGQVRFTSPTTGVTSEVEIVAIDAAVATALGLSAGVTVGVAAEPGTAQYSLKRMADPSGTSISGLKAYLLATIQASAILLTNPSSTAAVRGRFCVVGDLVTT